LAHAGAESDVVDSAVFCQLCCGLARFSRIPSLIDVADFELSLPVLESAFLPGGRPLDRLHIGLLRRFRRRGESSPSLADWRRRLVRLCRERFHELCLADRASERAFLEATGPADAAPPTQTLPPEGAPPHARASFPPYDDLPARTKLRILLSLFEWAMSEDRAVRRELKTAFRDAAALRDAGCGQDAHGNRYWWAQDAFWNLRLFRQSAESAQRERTRRNTGDSAATGPAAGAPVSARAAEMSNSKVAGGWQIVGRDPASVETLVAALRAGDNADEAALKRDLTQRLAGLADARERLDKARRRQARILKGLAVGAGAFDARRRRAGGAARGGPASPRDGRPSPTQRSCAAPCADADPLRRCARGRPRRRRKVVDYTGAAFDARIREACVAINFDPEKAAEAERREAERAGRSERLAQEAAAAEEASRLRREARGLRVRRRRA
jgi:hypothetical protein